MVVAGGALPRPAFCRYGDRRFGTLLGGKKCAGPGRWYTGGLPISHGEEHECGSIPTAPNTNKARWKTHSPLYLSQHTLASLHRKHIRALCGIYYRTLRMMTIIHILQKNIFGTLTTWKECLINRMIIK